MVSLSLSLSLMLKPAVNLVIISRRVNVMALTRPEGISTSGYRSRLDVPGGRCPILLGIMVTEDVMNRDYGW